MTPVHAGAQQQCSQQPKAEIMQMSVDRCADKQKVVHPFGGKLFSLKKECDGDSCHSVPELERHQTQRTRAGLVHVNVEYTQ